MANGVVPAKIKIYTITLTKAQYAAGDISISGISGPDSEIYIDNNKIKFTNPCKLLVFLNVAGQVISGGRYALQLRINGVQKTAVLNSATNSSYFACVVTDVYNVAANDELTVLTAETVGISYGYPDDVSKVTLIVF